MDIIYLVKPPFGDRALKGFATDAKGVEQIVKNHYRTCFSYPRIEVSVDMEALTVTASAHRYAKMYHIKEIKRAK
jgi:hypothetical protein